MVSLAACSFLQTFLDGRNIVESNMAFQRDVLGFSQQQNGN
jgi:hypothetical protein